MITYYMLAACRRNGAFTNLGVAARATYALGIHRHETNVAFIPEDGLARARAWKTLRVCDLFLSASMGRPPATSDAECNIVWDSVDQATHREGSNVSAQAYSAIFRICHVFERVLVEVYSKRSVSFEVATSISREHRRWTEELPRMLKIDGLQDVETGQPSRLSHRLGVAIVTMAYYYSIILLARPFLTFKVCHYPKIPSHGQHISPSMTSLFTYADACVDAAIKGINVAYEIVLEDGMPQRQPLVINSVFISILCLGLASLDNSDRRGWPLDQSMKRGIAILVHFADLNPQSARYAKICQLLRAAALKHAEQRDCAMMHTSSQRFCAIFGDVQGSTDPQVRFADVNQNTRVMQRQQPPGASNRTPAAPISPLSLDGCFIQHDSMISTSGLLDGQSPNSRAPHLDDTNSYASQYDFSAQDLDFSPSSGWGSLETPLFSLINDFTPT